MMTIRHLWSDNEAVTEALYLLDGIPSCARFLDHLTVDEVVARLTAYRAGRPS